jgi:hypothetical protein
MLSTLHILNAICYKAQNDRIVINNKFEWQQKAPAIRDRVVLREENNFNISSQVKRSTGYNAILQFADYSQGILLGMYFTQKRG